MDFDVLANSAFDPIYRFLNFQLTTKHNIRVIEWFYLDWEINLFVLDIEGLLMPSLLGSPIGGTESSKGIDGMVVVRLILNLDDRLINYQDIVLVLEFLLKVLLQPIIVKA